MTFILFSHDCPNMALYDDKSSTTKNLTLSGSTTSLRDMVMVSLNRNSTQPGFSRATGEYRI